MKQVIGKVVESTLSVVQMVAGVPAKIMGRGDNHHKSSSSTAQTAPGRAADTATPPVEDRPEPKPAAATTKTTTAKPAAAKKPAASKPAAKKAPAAKKPAAKKPAAKKPAAKRTPKSS